MMERKMLSALAVVLLAGSMSMAVTIDNFDNYANGAVSTVTENWEGTANATILNGAMQIAEGGGTGQQSAYGILPDSAVIAEGATSTLMFKFKRSNASVDQSLGLTDVDAPNLGGTDWGQFRPQVGITGGMIKARDGANGMRNLVTLTDNTWYYLWVVVNNAADNIMLYMNTTGADATEADLLLYNGTQSTFAFRVATTNALDRFYWRAQNNASDRVVTIDNVHVFSGVHLAIPEPATMLLLGLGGLFFARKR